MSINNCSTCEHSGHRQGERSGHCYMFKVEPREVCHQHTSRTLPRIAVPRELYASIMKKSDAPGLRIRLANASQLMGSKELSGLCHEAWERIRVLEAVIAKNEAPKPPPCDEPEVVGMVVTPQNTTPPNLSGPEGFFGWPDPRKRS